MYTRLRSSSLTCTYAPDTYPTVQLKPYMPKPKEEKKDKGE